MNCVRHLQSRDFDVALSASQDMKITVVGSGGLSHDPPTPRIDHSKPEATQRLVDRATPTQADYDARETRVIQAARDLVVGKGPCLPPSEQWDRDFLESFLGSRLERLRRDERRRDRPGRRLRRP